MCRAIAPALVIAGCASAARASLPASIFAPHSTPAREEHQLAIFVLWIALLIFLGVGSLLTYSILKFRARPNDDTEPPQVFGSLQIELSWTIIPILIIAVLFLGTARVLFSVQDAKKPANALDVVVIGHQFWWEYRYPQYNVVAANELHIPVSPASAPHPTFMKLTSADVMHSFWVPQLGGKTDLLPNRVNEMWIDPQSPGVYVGQCAQFCGPQHAKMLLRVSVDTPEEFNAWIKNQQRTQAELAQAQVALASVPNPGNQSKGSVPPNSPPTHGAVAVVPTEAPDNAINAHNGQIVFEQQACINCHAVAGTMANGRYGPDLTHLMSRATLGSGAAQNTPGNLLAWIADPNTFKPGCLMPAMHLNDRQNAQITAYLLTLK
ncbi:cytochrome c oxidase subunit II [Occallatibacter riparius]|uniref:Cytochrome c oxidase subunit 2 n=1 Tax=Occallatibacter riparius TaxID=1002689 RepID=A0A9J7BS26_9BACT|nr:cytochrome c oxidase subunit II [Occallatibacter riparius]UWZ85377.1 cytochrome c oxidase subunit II [Occallatibacter riparius]